VQLRKSHIFVHVHKLKLSYVFIYGNPFAFIENVFDNKCLIINKYIYIYVCMYIQFVVILLILIMIQYKMRYRLYSICMVFILYILKIDIIHKISCMSVIFIFSFQTFPSSEYCTSL